MADLRIGRGGMVGRGGWVTSSSCILTLGGLISIVYRLVINELAVVADPKFKLWGERSFHKQQGCMNQFRCDRIFLTDPV